MFYCFEIKTAEGIGNSIYTWLTGFMKASDFLCDINSKVRELVPAVKVATFPIPVLEPLLQK